jgi:hypothetical protein
MTELAKVPEVRDLIPVTAADLAEASDRIVHAVQEAARRSVEAELPTFRQDFSGAEQKAILAQRGLEILKLADISFEAAGGELLEQAEEALPFHPDPRGDPQELKDELMDGLSQRRKRQMLYIVRTALPFAERLGVNIQVWLNHTTKWKLLEMTPAFRQTLEDSEISEEDRIERFLELVALCTRTTSEIRKARMLNGPEVFYILERATGNGYEWHLSGLTKDTRNWLLRKAQPYARLRS